MNKDIELVERYDQMDKVVKLYLKGESIPSIMKQLKMPRVDVQSYVDEYRQVAINDPVIKERARETLTGYDRHTSEIIRRLWEVVEEADVSNDLKSKAQALKSLSDIDRARVETLQKAGLYDDAAMGDELAKTQEQAEEIKKLLKAVVEQYPQTKGMILSGISRIFNETVGVPITTEVIIQPTSE